MFWLRKQVFLVSESLLVSEAGVLVNESGVLLNEAGAYPNTCAGLPGRPVARVSADALGRVPPGHHFHPEERLGQGLWMGKGACRTLPGSGRMSMLSIHIWKPDFPKLIHQCFTLIPEPPSCKLLRHKLCMNQVLKDVSVPWQLRVRRAQARQRRFGQEISSMDSKALPQRRSPRILHGRPCSASPTSSAMLGSAKLQT